MCCHHLLHTQDANPKSLCSTSFRPVSDWTAGRLLSRSRPAVYHHPISPTNRLMLMTSFTSCQSNALSPFKRAQKMVVQRQENKGGNHRIMTELMLPESKSGGRSHVASEERCFGVCLQLRTLSRLKRLENRIEMCHCVVF